MRICIFNFFVVFTVLLLKGQNLTGVIKYRLNISHGFDNRDLTSYLYFNDKKSLYAYDRLAYMTKEDSAEKAVVIAGQGKSKRKRDKYGQMYLVDKTTGKLSFREFIFSGVYISQEDIPVIPWQLENETKVILGKVCKKATAEFRRRKYTAWYTSSIPVSVGPWKLQGLPGAILEAESEDGEVKFSAESIRIPAYVERQLNPQELPDGKIVSYQEYLDAFEKERKVVEQQMRNMFSILLEEEVKKGNLKMDPNTASQGLSVRKLKFRLEKYE